MKRRRRILLESVTVLSLFLCAVVIALWIRSYFGADTVSRRTMTADDDFRIQHESQELQFTRGCARVILAQDAYYHRSIVVPALRSDDSRPTWSYFRYGRGFQSEETPAPRSFWNHLGFAAWTDGWMSSFADNSRRVWAAPLWPLAALFAALPALRLAQFLRRRSQRIRGHCQRCGYDLRATPNRCPECGATPFLA